MPAKGADSLMPNQVLSSPEIVSALIALVGVIISVVASYFSAKLSASREFKRLKLKWAHEAEVTSSAEFSEMSAAVATYLSSSSGYTYQTAIASVSALRSKSSGKTAEALDRLYKTLYAVQDPFEPNREQINTTLSFVIQYARAEDVRDRSQLKRLFHKK